MTSAMTTSKKILLARCVRSPEFTVNIFMGLTDSDYFTGSQPQFIYPHRDIQSQRGLHFEYIDTQIIISLVIVCVMH